MIPEITQQNLHLLLPGKITALAQFYAEDHGCTMFEAKACPEFVEGSPLCLTALRTSGRREHQTLAAGSHHAVWGGGAITKDAVG